MTKLAPEWVRTSDPVIRSPARYRWTTAPALNSDEDVSSNWLQGSEYDLKCNDLVIFWKDVFLFNYTYNIIRCLFVCWSLTSLCHSNGHMATMPAREINPFTALTRIRSQFLRTQWSTSNHSEWTRIRLRPLSHRGWHIIRRSLSDQYVQSWFSGDKSNEYIVSNQFIHYLSFIKSPNRKIITNLRIGNSVLNGHRHMPESEQKCASCMNYNENLYHFLLECDKPKQIGDIFLNDRTKLIKKLEQILCIPVGPIMRKLKLKKLMLVYTT